MRQFTVKLNSGESVTVYSDEGHVILQVRRLVHGDADPLAASFKSGVVLTPAEASKVAAELLGVAADAARKVNVQ